MDISSEMAPPKPLEPTTGSMGTFDDSFDDYELQSGSSKWIRIAATLLFVGVIIAGGWVYLQHPEWLGIVPTPDSEVQTPAVDAGDVSSEVAVVQADTASGGDASDASPDVVEAKGDTGNARNRNAKVEGRKRSEKVRGLADKKKADPGAAGFEGSIQRGNRALKSGKKQRALEAFSAAVRENPGSAEAHRGLGWSYVSLGLSSGAVRSFKAAIRLNPRYGDAYIGLGKAYRMAGNKAAAVKAYERYLAMYPSGPSAYTARYQVETLKGKSKAPSKAPSPSDKSAVPSGGGSNSAPPGATVGPLPDKVKKK